MFDSLGALLYLDLSQEKSIITRDALGNILTRRKSDGWYVKFTRDTFGNVLTFKDSTGRWEEYTRDISGNVLTQKHSVDNILLTCIARDEEYDLFVSEDRTCIRAGCRRFDSVSKALEHWSRRTDARAILFTEALRKLLPS